MEPLARVEPVGARLIAHPHTHPYTVVKVADNHQNLGGHAESLEYCTQQLSVDGVVYRGEIDEACGWTKSAFFLRENTLALGELAQTCGDELSSALP